MAKHFDAVEAERVPLLDSFQSSPILGHRTRCRRPRCWHYIIGLLLLALISAIYITFLTSRSDSKEFPPDGPGIGISLSTYYGTISIRYEDGTISNVGKIEAKREYVDLLRRLSLSSSQHPTPPYRSFSEAMRDRPRQWRRSLRKQAGYPASPDVSILSQMLGELIAATEGYLSSSRLPLSSALVTLPNVIALYPEDARDALEYLGLQALTGHNVYAVPRALPAAYAGYGMGLCANPNDFDLCLDEEQDMPARGVLAVDMSSASLGIDARGMDTPMYVFNEDKAILDWNGGLASGETDGDYWERVRKNIRQVLDGLVQRSGKPQGEKVVDEVLMIGEMGDDKILAAAVKEVVAEVQQEEATIWSEDPQFIAARGAAELAKRLLLQGGRVR